MPASSNRTEQLAHALLILFLAFLLPLRAEDAPTPAIPETPAEQPATAGTPDAPAEGSREEIIGSVSLVERLGQGGFTMYFLGALSIVALTFALERLVNLNRSRIFPRGLAEKVMGLWNEKKYEDILTSCQARPSTLSSVVSALVRHRHCSPLEISMLAGDIAGRDMRGHLQKAYPIAIVATLSPLLGLLGTVIGMIESFEVVAIAGSLGDASMLAGGISKALVTTATGLIIAVPALGLYHFFKSKTHTFTMALEGEVHELLTSWFLGQDNAAEEAEEG